MKKIKKKICNETQNVKSYGLKITHTKFVWNQRQKFFFPFQMAFGAFLIFKVLMWGHWSTIMDINGGIDSLEHWKSDVNGCLNNQRNYLETNFWQ